MSDAPDADEYDLATRDHDEIRRWVDERGGYPAEADDDDDGTTDLRIALADDEDSRLDWEEFFERLDENDLAVAYRVAADEDAAAEAEHEAPRDPSETVDGRSEMRSSDAADEATLDNHRDQPPHES